jgi:general stress protein CsbA
MMILEHGEVLSVSEVLVPTVFICLYCTITNESLVLMSDHMLLLFASYSSRYSAEGKMGNMTLS